jgi:hypothetical protein
MIGDIYGRPGRETTLRELPKLRKELDLDLVIANGENVSGGRGMLPAHYELLLGAGIDLFTSGNHIFGQKQTRPLLEQKDAKLIRPANYPPAAPGRGNEVISTRAGRKVAVLNLLGRVFMRENTDDPFRTAEAWLGEAETKSADERVIDFHAEATSEKVCLATFLDGRVSAVLGTHTHVPTADSRILPEGTGFQSDVGMVGPIYSSLGVKAENVIESFLTQLPFKHEVASGSVAWNSTLLELESGKTKSIQLVHRIFD